MKKKTVILVLILLPVFLSAQQSFRPIIDSTATCSYFDFNYGFSENPSTAKQVLQVFHIVENMPSPKTSAEKMAEILNFSIRFNEQEKSFSEDIFIQCVVNCKGKAGDFQILDCPPVMVNIGCQVLQVFKDNLTEWKPGIQRGKAVDVLVSTKVAVEDGKFHLTGS